MRDAFSVIYGSFRSPMGTIFGPVIQPRTYLRAIHLLAMFPLGLAYFVALVVSLSVGGALIWTLVGPIILIVTLFLTRWAGDAEAWMVRRVALIELRRPPTAIESGLSARDQVWTRIIDPTTWTGIVYLFVQFPVGVGMLAGLAAAGWVSVVFTGAPAIFALSSTHLDIGSAVWLNTWQEGFILVPIGLLTFLVTVHLVNVISAVHASWARLMLGSRAKNIPEVPTDTEPPAGDDQDSRTTVPEPTVLPQGQSPAAGHTALASLTPREQEVLGLIARGHSNAEMGEAFVISEGTAKTHVKRILSKPDLSDRAQATSFAYEIGFVRPRDAAPSAAPISITSRRRAG